QPRGSLARGIGQADWRGRGRYAHCGGLAGWAAYPRSRGPCRRRGRSSPPAAISPPPEGDAAGSRGYAPQSALLMIYVDTSALVPIFIREPKSEAVIGWIESSGERLAISEWSLVEFASAAAIKVRTGQPAANLVKQATG